MQMKAFTDELTKIALQPGTAQILKILGIAGGGYLGGKTLEQAGTDWRLGRRLRKQMEQRQAQMG